MGQEKNDPGQDYKPDQDLANGPINDRKCQDLICLVLFLANVVALVVIASFGLQNGKPERMAVGYDSSGRACGLDDPVSDQKYIYMPVPWKGYFNRSMCVKECPTWIDGEDTKPKQLQCELNIAVATCEQQIPGGKGFNQIFSMIQDNNYAKEFAQNTTVIIYNTTGYWDRVCLPVNLDFITQTDVSSIVNTSKFEEYFSDIKNSWQIILASAGIAFIVGLVYMIVMRYFAGLLTWIAIILYFVLLALLGYYFYVKARDVSADPTASEKDLENAKNNRYISYALFGVLIISFIIFLCQFNNIRLAIAIIKSAASFTGDVQSAFLVPPVFVVLCCIFWAYWIVLFVFLYASGEIKGRADNPFATVTWSEDLKRIIWYHLFGGLWCNALLMSLSQFILASSCCIWYFSQGDNGLIHFPVSKSVYRAFRFHFGSLAFGALILAIVQTLRVFLAYLTYQAEMMKGKDNKCLKCLLRFLSCYVACFQRCVKFLNKNAFIQIALTGKSFFTAAKEGFWLIYTNPGKFSIVNGIGQVFIFIGQLFISIGTAYVCYMIFTHVEKYKKILFSPILPTVFCFAVAYTIASFFLSVYGMAIDSILQCAITDEQLMQSKGQPPKHCPQPLQEFFEKEGTKQQ